MPLRDYFSFQDPMVQAGYMTRGDNWQMRLGALAQALGGMDRAGQLGQALAQAGGLYQQQRQGVLASAFERAQEEAKQRREDELLRMRYEEHNAGVEERKRQAEERERQKAIEDEQWVISREADRRWLQENELPMQYADSPETMRTLRKQVESRDTDPEYKYLQMSGGRFLRTTPQGEEKVLDFGPGRAEGKAPDPQDEFLRSRGYDPADPLAGERYRRDAGFGPAAKAGADPVEEMMESADSIYEDDAWRDGLKEQFGDDYVPSYDEAVAEAQKRKRAVESILGPRPSNYIPGSGTAMDRFKNRRPLSKSVIDSRAQDYRGGIHKVKPAGGEVIAGMTMPTPGKSSFGTGKTEMLKAQPSRTPEVARSLVVLEAAADQFKQGLPPDQQAAFDAYLKQRVAAGEDPETIARELEAKLSMIRARQ